MVRLDTIERIRNLQTDISNFLTKILPMDKRERLHQLYVNNTRTL